MIAVSGERKWGETGTFLDEVPTTAFEGEKRNEDDVRVAVLRWHFEGDDIQYNRQALVQREMAAYAIKQELEAVRDLLLEVADQPDVEMFKQTMKDALDERIEHIEDDTGD